METVSRLIKEKKLVTHREKGGVYCMINDDSDLVKGTGGDRGRSFYLYVDMVPLDQTLVKEGKQVYMRDTQDWSKMRLITAEDDVTRLAKVPK